MALESGGEAMLQEVEAEAASGRCSRKGENEWLPLSEELQVQMNPARRRRCPESRRAD